MINSSTNSCNSNSNTHNHPHVLPTGEEHLNDTALRYLAFTSRLTRLSRYLAFTSDVGEAFRPIIPRHIVQASYAISWAYCAIDVGYEGYKENKKGSKSNKELALIMAERGVFQALASMALPAFTIHTQVHLFQKIFAKVGRFQKWGPTMAGLALLPALPYMFDKPVEHAVATFFNKYIHLEEPKHKD